MNVVLHAAPMHVLTATLAASLGNNAAVAALLNRGANPSLVDRTGRSALARAREAQNIGLVKLLEKAGKSAAAKS